MHILAFCQEIENTLHVQSRCLVDCSSDAVKNHFVCGINRFGKALRFIVIGNWLAIGARSNLADVAKCRCIKFAEKFRSWVHSLLDVFIDFAKELMVLLEFFADDVPVSAVGLEVKGHGIGEKILKGVDQGSPLWSWLTLNLDIFDVKVK
jgi:hypothetical protein